MARGRASENTMAVEDLEMALVGYRMKQQELEERIRRMRGENDDRGSGASQARPAGKAAKGSPRKALSAAARKRIAVAQKKRWAEHRKKLAQAAKAE